MKQRFVPFLILSLVLMMVFPLSINAQVIKTIPAPNYPYGLTFDGTYLWVGTSYANTSGDFLWKINPADGSVAGTIPVPDPNGFYTVKALAWDGQYLWVFEDLPSASHPDKFYKVDPNTGAVLKTLNSPENNYIGGMDYFDDHIWYSQYYASQVNGRDVIIKMDTTGVPVDTIVTVGEQPMGVAYDGQFVWCAEDTGYGANRQEMYAYDPASGAYTGNFFHIPTASPRDMAYDGAYFWLISYNAANSIIYQFGTMGGTPEITLAANELDFGLAEIGQAETSQINVQNTGTADLSIDSLNFTNGVFGSAVATFPVVIPPGNASAIGVTFTPVNYGSVNGIMNIFSNDPVTPTASVSLTGKGLYSDPTIGLSAASFNFGNVWIPEDGLASRELRITNRGIQNLQISAFNLTEPVFWVDSGPLPLTLVPDDTVSVTLWFGPQQAITYTDVLEIDSNDPATPVASVNLQGTGLAGPFDLGYQFWNYQVPDNPATTFNEYRPLALKSINDVTGDGISDVIIATRNYWTIMLNGASSGFASELWRFSSYISSYSAGGIGNTNDLPPQQKALAVANDLNGDGFQDIVIGTGGGNERVYALSGADGEVIWKFGTDAPDSFGLGDMTSVYVNEDYNSDGVNDVIATGSATNSGVEGRRRVYCFNGANGQILWQYFLGCFIRMAEAIGDVNGNGSPEVVAGTGDGVANAYTVVGIDPEGPTLIWSFPVGSSAGGGKEILRYDIDGETSDVIAGSYFGKVWRIDGESGVQVWLFDLGSSGINQLSILEDVNGDGLNDILVCSFASVFYCVSGADGAVLWSVPVGNFSWSAQAIPDITGDGHQDVVMACRNDNLYVLNGMDGAIELQYPMNSGMLQGATLAYTLPDIDNNNSYEILGAADNGKIVALSGGTAVGVGIEDDQPAVPAQFSLKQNYPNPFNPTTNIGFQIADRGFTELKIYDVLGREIKTLVNQELSPGSYKLEWDGANRSGQRMPSGIYFYRLVSGEFTQIRKMILMR